MNFTLVYDIRDDTPWDSGYGGALVLLVLSAVFLACAARSLLRRPVPKQPWWGFLILAFGCGAFGLMNGLSNYDRLYLRNSLSQQLQHGMCSVTEGEIQRLKVEVPKSRWTSFVVGEKKFEFNSGSRAFRGAFNQPGVTKSSLSDGMHVRIWHDTLFILRIEVRH